MFFVYPVYSAMLGHLRSKALADFQVRLEQSLNKGEGFASSVLSLLCLSLRKDVQFIYKIATDAFMCRNE
ncbi:hypothetical protein DVH24_011118 [Malus domestica]|uniref:Sey1/RHD3-like three-helix bundle domain-containing protein n=1 Tax=Malus domestica TaxID=3750 RepID=A0A498JXU8_MALDO|nr:hypothetical protein DVH24_011118 [Malus domestica]